MKVSDSCHVVLKSSQCSSLLGHLSSHMLAALAADRLCYHQTYVLVDMDFTLLLIPTEVCGLGKFVVPHCNLLRFRKL